VHHDSAMSWLAELVSDVREKPTLALCAITEGALVRQVLRDSPADGVSRALALLQAVKSWPSSQFWSDAPSYVDIDWRGVMGHKQVTDAYLAALPRSRNARLASFDRGLAALRPGIVCLVPSG
jgi:hypothetical protein